MEIWRRRVIVADEDLDFENNYFNGARRIRLTLKLVKKFLKSEINRLRKKSYFWLYVKTLFLKYMRYNTNLYKQFKDLIGEIYTAEVHHVRPRVVILVG
jgi:N utilization substance protein A